MPEQPAAPIQSSNQSPEENGSEEDRLENNNSEENTNTTAIDSASDSALDGEQGDELDDLFSKITIDEKQDRSPVVQERVDDSPPP